LTAIAPGKRTKLKAFLRALPPAAMLRLAAAAQTGAGRDPLMAGLAPVLREAILAGREALEIFAERGPREILAALPMRYAGFTGGPVAADLARGRDAAMRARALNRAAAIAGCARLSFAPSVDAALTRADAEIREALAAYNDAILRELRTAEGEARMHAQSCFDLAAELTARVFGADESERLRRRAAAQTAA
jgi:hypothetical protein